MIEYYCQVSEASKSKVTGEIDTVLTDMPICPYCGCDHREWYFEMAEDGRYECAECGETFELEAVRELKFTTSKTVESDIEL